MNSVNNRQSINFQLSAISIKEKFCNYLQNYLDNPKCCEDQYVGKIVDILGPDGFKRESVSKRLADNPCYILILESPHTEEFVDDPAAPAKGRTGTYIRNHISEVLGLTEDKKGYGLILMNAIQYQCSLGISTECVRDEIFRKVWIEGGKEDFRNRLGRTFMPNDVLVNSCTAGNKAGQGYELRVLVQQEINDLGRELKFGNVMKKKHPSSWQRSGKKRAVEWKYQGK